MSPDEAFVLMTTASVAVWGWGRWYYRLLRSPRMGVGGWSRVVLGLWPILVHAGIYMALRRLASGDVRHSALYLAFYLVFGAAWVAMCRWFAALLGVSWVDDALERRNPAAVLAISGALAGAAAAYTGGNVGDGPAWWCVLVAGGLATLALFVAWWLLEKVATVSETITVDRDVGAGIRIGVWLLACGLIAGRGAAGDWFSVGSTVVDFATTSWPMAALLVVAVLVERWRVSRAARGGMWLGPSLALSVLYLATAAAVLVLSPAPAENPLFPLE